MALSKSAYKERIYISYLCTQSALSLPGTALFALFSLILSAVLSLITAKAFSSEEAESLIGTTYFISVGVLTVLLSTLVVIYLSHRIFRVISNPFECKEKADTYTTILQNYPPESFLQWARYVPLSIELPTDTAELMLKTIYKRYNTQKSSVGIFKAVAAMCRNIEALDAPAKVLGDFTPKTVVPQVLNGNPNPNPQENPNLVIEDDSTEEEEENPNGR